MTAGANALAGWLAAPMGASMDIGFDTIALLALVALLGGLVDSIAGGGGLLVMPALLWTGMSPLQALATNKLQAVFGTATACTRFAKAGLIEWRPLLPALALTFAGACGGAITVQMIDARWLKLIVPVLLVLAALYFLLSPRMDDSDAHKRLTLIGYVPIACAIGFYDGFFGPGTGSFFAVSLVALAGMGLTRATAHTKALNFTTNVASVLLFAFSGHMLWLVGFAMAVGQIVGASLGSHLALRHGARLIRPLLVIISLGLTARMLFDPENPLRQLL
jgi:uncharacterized membrane protein YfcA